VDVDSFKTVAEFLVRTEEKYEKSAKIIDAVAKIKKKKLHPK
jgi:hypothetical protein